MFSFRLDQETTNLLSVLLPLLLQLAGLAFAVRVDGYIGKTQKRVYTLVILLVLLLIAQNYLDNYLSNSDPRPMLRTGVSILGYCLRPAILLLFFYLLEPRRSFWEAWILVIVNAGIHLTAFFADWVFCISPDNHYLGGPLNPTCLIISLILLAALLWATLRRYRETKGPEIAIAVLIVPILVASLILDGHVGLSSQNVTFLTIAIVVCCVLYYLWLHLQFVREHERDLMAQQRMQIMVSQIQPHFLYNSLGAIEALCDTDPQAAKAATVKFSKYLRSNLDSISTDGPVPFQRELAHTRMYLELEQIRFEDALRVVYDIQVTDFTLPALTLEPLAENAVRHGIRGNADGSGTVTISTRETADAIEISVRDDGPGFDPKAQCEDGRSHIGIQNVTHRLERISGGSLRIDSAPGAGTVATIRLPKKGTA